MLQRLMREGDARHGETGEDLRPEHARSLLRVWLEAIGFEGPEPELLSMLQASDFSHAALYRHARHSHERKLVRAADQACAAITDGGDLGAAATALFEACVPTIPYVAATAFLGRERAKVADRDGEVPRVALVADGLEAMHGVTHTLEEVRARGVPGFEVDVIGTDRSVDRRLPAVAELEMPLYDGLRLGVPTLPRLVETLADGAYDVVHLCSPGPAGLGATLAAKLMAKPMVGSYHTELAAYANVRSGDPRLGMAMHMALAAFYGQCDVVLSPSAATDESLHALGIPAERIERWTRGVDTERFHPGKRAAGVYPGEVNVLYAGRQTREKGVELLADAFLAARRVFPDLHLVLAGGGPEEGLLRERVGDHATFLGWLEGDELAQAYASADLLLFPSRTDTFGQVLLEAQASGLPVVAVGEGGPTSIVADGITGRLCAADATALADAVVFGTGYAAEFPFLPAGLPLRLGGALGLYRLVFPPDQERIAFVGLSRVNGPVFPVAEMQARWAAAVFAGQARLPEPAAMRAEIEERVALASRQGTDPMRVELLDYLDEIGGRIGVRPSLIRHPGLLIAPVRAADYRAGGPRGPVRH